MGERILLFRQMLEDSGFPGAEALCDAMTNGLPIGRSFPAAGVFPSAVREAEQSVEDFLEDAAGDAERVIATCGPSGDEAMDKELFDTTLGEVTKGWLRGPFSLKSCAAMGRLPSTEGSGSDKAPR